MQQMHICDALCKIYLKKTEILESLLHNLWSHKCEIEIYIFNSQNLYCTAKCMGTGNCFFMWYLQQVSIGRAEDIW